MRVARLEQIHGYLASHYELSIMLSVTGWSRTQHKRLDERCSVTATLYDSALVELFIGGIE
jgi:hypothetical protein